MTCIVQSNTLLLDDVFENFRNMSLKTDELDPAKFLSTLGFAWQAASKKTRVKLDILSDTDMLLMVENVSEEKYVTLFINMQKLITNT